MIRFILLLCLVCTTFDNLPATRPIRTLRLQQADGTTVSVPLPEELRNDEGCPSRFSQRNRASRAFGTSSADGLGRLGFPSQGILPSLGEPLIPVVMVEFSDVAFQPTTTPERIDSLFSGENCAINRRAKGSVRDYFRAQSYGRFVPHFKVVAKVRVSKNRAYYGANSTWSKNINIRELYRESIALAQKQGADFSSFVAGGRIPLTVLFHAGPGEHDSFEAGREEYPWAHFAESTLTSGGLRFDSYFVGCELMQSYVQDPATKRPKLDQSGLPIVESADLEGIGVFCHEMGHALGLPDFYSTNEVQKTPDFHDIMDYAQYGNEGYRPLGYSAYERSYMGWLNLRELTDTDAGRHSLAALHDTLPTAPQAYLIRSTADSKEYYILENRQPGTWFAGVLGHGMLVYHIHYDVNAWSSNMVNTSPTHLRCVVVPADNAWQHHKGAKAADFQGDFFPGLKGITELSAGGTPAMSWYSGGAERPLYDIQEESTGHVAFSFLHPTPTGINAFTASEHAEDAFTLDGRRVKLHNAPAGLYLQQGRKVIIR